MSHDVFISHSSKDKPIADAVCAVLETHGIRCWIAPRDIIPGTDWGESIVDAIRDARVMVLVFSANANNSPQIKREVERAANRNIPIIPLRIEGILPTASLEYFLSTPHWLDAFPPPMENHLQRLAQVIRKILGAVPPETAPVSPPVVTVAPERTEAVKPAPGRPWKFKFATVAAVLILLLCFGGWYFGVHLPAENQRKAEFAQIAAVRTRQKTEGEHLANRPEAGQPWTIPGINLVMQPIPAGTFTMGSPESESGRMSNEGPQHQVTLTQPFWLGRFDVVQAQWQALMGNNPSHFKGDDLPVEQVSWEDAMEFCRRLTERERSSGRLPEGYAYTLPTEAQWEYACRAGTTTRFNKGDSDGDLDRAGWYAGNSNSQSHPVGQKQPNAWGLYDMHGNVWQWCADGYGNYPSESATDPTGSASGSNRVDRGGGWGSAAARCRSAHRFYYEPGYRSSFLGFRLALRTTAVERITR